MIVALEVHQRGTDGITLARTTVALDGSVVTALRPELLDAPQVLQAHLDEVGRRVRQWSERARWAARIMSYGPIMAVVGAIGSGVMAGWDAWRGALVRAALWGVGMLGCALLRFTLRRIAQRWLQRWLERV